MSAGGALPAGSSRELRLDPFSLPVRYTDDDGTADGRVRHVELHRERVVLRRTVAGMRMALNLPITAYRGVSFWVEPEPARTTGTVAIVLEHPDPALSLPLGRASNPAEVMAEWQSWARVLGLPLLAPDDTGTLHELQAYLGKLQIASPIGRRWRRGTVKYRRPSILMRRKPGVLVAASTVHAGEREIIARN